MVIAAADEKAEFTGVDMKLTMKPVNYYIIHYSINQSIDIGFTVLFSSNTQ